MDRGRPPSLEKDSNARTQRSRRGNGEGTYTRSSDATREAPTVVERHQPAAREGQAGPYGVAERPVVPEKPGNAGGGKGPWFKGNVKGARTGRLVCA